VLVRADQSKDIEMLVLRHENQVLRRQLGGRLRWDHADRLWLAALSRLGRPSTGTSVRALIVQRGRPAIRPPKRVVAGVINEYHHAA
jgi:hypothetical protein